MSPSLRTSYTKPECVFPEDTALRMRSGMGVTDQDLFGLFLAHQTDDWRDLQWWGHSQWCRHALHTQCVALRRSGWVLPSPALPGKSVRNTAHFKSFVQAVERADGCWFLEISVWLSSPERGLPLLPRWQWLPVSLFISGWICHSVLSSPAHSCS